MTTFNEFVQGVHTGIARDIERNDSGYIGWQGALMHAGFNRVQPIYPTVNMARHASVIQSTDYTKAPKGAFHYWLSPPDGCVAFDLDGGGERLLTSDRHLVVPWGQDAGIIHRDIYAHLAYIGWSLTYGEHVIEENR